MYTQDKLKQCVLQFMVFDLLLKVNRNNQSTDAAYTFTD